MARTAFIRSVTTAWQWASASHGHACMPLDTARDAEFELQLVMTSPLVTFGRWAACGYCMFLGHQYKFGSQI